MMTSFPGLFSPAPGRNRDGARTFQSLITLFTRPLGRGSVAMVLLTMAAALTLSIASYKFHCYSVSWKFSAPPHKGPLYSSNLKISKGIFLCPASCLDYLCHCPTWRLKNVSQGSCNLNGSSWVRSCYILESWIIGNFTAPNSSKL